MKKVWILGITVVAIGAAFVSAISMRDDGGVLAVLRDEVPPLAAQWVGTSEDMILSYAVYVPATFAVAAGARAGEADYDKSGLLGTQLTNGIPMHTWRGVMQYDNLAAAQRARRRQLRRLASTDTEQRFFDLFPSWWSAQLACLESDEELDLIRALAPSIAVRIDAKNAEFRKLSAKEVAGTLTVAERTIYLADNLRVPHLMQLPGGHWYDWKEVDPTDQLSSYQSEGPTVRQCPEEDHSHGWHIQACFEYVNIDLHGYGGMSTYGHVPPTVLGLEVYRNAEQNDGPFEFVLQMMEYNSGQADLKAEAQQNVESMPATDVSAGVVKGRVNTEYKKLRCQK